MEVDYNQWRLTEVDLRKFYVENKMNGGLSKNHRILKYNITN